MELSPSWLKQHCKDNGGYSVPELNDKLFLGQKGIVELTSLEGYTGLLSLFLEGNGIDCIQGLEAQTKLRCLFLQGNQIHEIENLEHLQMLDTLNVSNNPITKLENLSCLPVLNTLQASACKLKTPASIAHLAECKTISVLDLQHNEIKGEGSDVLEVLKQMPSLGVLYLQGNPFVSTMRHYRKTMIASLPGLKYLDDRPVFDNERATAEAFVRGGIEAEREERRRQTEAKEAKDNANYLAMKAWRAENVRGSLEWDEANGKGEEDGDEDDWAAPEEPPELVSARSRLAAFTARPGEEEPPELSSARMAAAAAGGGGVRAAEWQGSVEARPAPPGMTVEEVKGGGGCGCCAEGGGCGEGADDDVPPLEEDLDGID